MELPLMPFCIDVVVVDVFGGEGLWWGYCGVKRGKLFGQQLVELFGGDLQNERHNTSVVGYLLAQARVRYSKLKGTTELMRAEGEYVWSELESIQAIYLYVSTLISHWETTIAQQTSLF